MYNKHFEAFDVPKVLQETRSRSKSQRRQYSPRATIESKKYLEQTYNAEYKRAEIEGNHASSHIKKNKAVHPSDFNVCPKYLTTATDFDDLASVNTETRRFRESRKTDSSEKKRHLERTFADDRVDFIHNYNDLVMKNRVLSREVARLKKHLGLDEEKPPAANLTTVPKMMMEESKGKLEVKPQQAPMLDGPSDFRHLSPIVGAKVNYSTPPDFNESKRKQMGLHSTINFNLTSSVKKDTSAECCNHEAQAKSLAFEVERLEKIVSYPDTNLHRQPTTTSPSKRVSFPEAQDEIQSLRVKMANQEAEIAGLKSQLKITEEAAQKAKRDFENKEAAFRTETSQLLKDKTSLIEDKAKLIAEINKLRFEGPSVKGTEASDRSQELARLLAESESLIQNLTKDKQAIAEERQLLNSRLVLKEDELKRTAEVLRQHEDTIIRLQADLVQVATNNRSPQHKPSTTPLLGQSEVSPAAETRDLKTRIQELTGERDKLESEVKQLRAAMANLDEPLRLKRHPKSFHQIARQGADLKQYRSAQGKKGSAMSEHEEDGQRHAENEPSLGEENARRSEGPDKSLSARIKGSGQ